MSSSTQVCARLAPFALALVIAGCGSMNVNLWPFGGGSARERSRAPADATEFNCAAGKRFFVRYLEGGKSAWLMLPEREFRLDRAAGAAGMRFSNGTATLEVDGATATLNDGPLTAYSECKSGAAERAAGG